MRMLFNIFKDLHNRYVIVPIDKAANNISIICKRFYVLRLLKEVGAIGNVDPTYEISNINHVDLINEDVMLCERYGLKIEEGQKTLPIMYWTPKMHYTPSRARFIVSSAKCSTKPISRLVSNAFKLIFNQILKIFMLLVNFIKITIGFGSSTILNLLLRGWML